MYFIHMIFLYFDYPEVKRTIKFTVSSAIVTTPAVSNPTSAIVHCLKYGYHSISIVYLSIMLFGKCFAIVTVHDL